MTIDELIDRVKVGTKANARKAVIQYLLGFIGPPVKYDYLKNKYREELRRRVGEL